MSPHLPIAAMSDPPLPARLAEIVEVFDLLDDRSQRIQLLMDYSARFTEVPERIATRPFDETHRVPACESEAFVWAEPRPDGTLDFHFAVENPQGISARALAVILGDSASGAPLSEIAMLDDNLIYRIFGRELSMGKSMGLTGIVAMVRRFAAEALARR